MIVERNLRSNAFRGCAYLREGGLPLFTELPRADIPGNSSSPKRMLMHGLGDTDLACRVLRGLAGVRPNTLIRTWIDMQPGGAESTRRPNPEGGYYALRSGPPGSMPLPATVLLKPKEPTPPRATRSACIADRCLGTGTGLGGVLGATSRLWRLYSRDALQGGG